MTTVAVMIALAVVLAVFDYPWFSIALIVTAALLASRATTAVQNWIENRTGRKPDPESEKYAATYFVISLGTLFAVGFYFPSTHPLTYGALGMLVFSGATAIGTFFFGRKGPKP